MSAVKKAHFTASISDRKFIWGKIAPQHRICENMARGTPCENTVKI
jgi:hypothetical protein